MPSNVIDYSSAFLKLNISGKRYKILKASARRYPGSLLGELVGIEEAGEKAMASGERMSEAAASCFYLVDSREFYLERSPAPFELVLQFVFSGELHCPAAVCREMLASEVAFWRLPADQASLAQCCQQDKGKDDDDDDPDQDQPDTSTFLGKVWLCCENPTSSIAASVLNVVSITFILLSIVNLLLSTVKSLQHCEGDSPVNGNQSINTSSPNQTEQYADRCDGGPVFDTIEAVCIGWFTLELVVRFAACPRKRAFFKSALNIIDLLSTVPFYIELLLPSSNGLSMIYVLRILRILRVMRALRLARYFDSVRIMGETFKKCRKDFGVLVVFILMATVISSSVVYYFERDEPGTQFTSIPASFWWCIVTLTTVGYGDTFPLTTAGRMCTGVVCVLGVILLAMPISIMVEQFSEQYKARNRKAKGPKLATLLRKAAAGKKEKDSDQVMHTIQEGKY